MILETVSPGINVHNKVSKFFKQDSLERLRKEVSDHLPCWTILHGNLLCGDAVGDEEVPDVDVPSTFATGCSSMFFKEDGALVVLIDHGVFDAVALCLQEIPGPQNLGHDVIHAHQFGFR